jgi:hypothetical protein
LAQDLGSRGKNYTMYKFAACFAALILMSFSFSGKSGSSVLTSPQITEKDGPMLRTFKNEAFKRGEVLTYKMSYGFIEAGQAVLEIKDEAREIGGRRTYHMVGTGVSKGTFDWFFKVRDRYETYIDEDAIIPWVFIRRVSEGGYNISQDYVFNHHKRKVDIGEGRIFDVPENVQDMLSAFYFTRCLDFTNAKEGDIFSLQCFVDKEIFPMKIKFAGRETIKTHLGRFRCLKFRPVVQKGRVFKREEDLNVWITDDKNHIPVRAQASLMVGSIKMDLSAYSGLANPISKVN